MKVQITFKTPDAVEDAIRGLSEKEKELVKKITNKYIDYGELITIEVDTATEELKVI